MNAIPEPLWAILTVLLVLVVGGIAMWIGYRCPLSRVPPPPPQRSFSPEPPTSPPDVPAPPPPPSRWQQAQSLSEVPDREFERVVRRLIREELEKVYDERE